MARVVLRRRSTVKRLEKERCPARPATTVPSISILSICTVGPSLPSVCLVTGSCVIYLICETIPTGCPRSRSRVSLVLSIFYTPTCRCFLERRHGRPNVVHRAALASISGQYGTGHTSRGWRQPVPGGGPPDAEKQCEWAPVPHHQPTLTRRRRDRWRRPRRGKLHIVRVQPLFTLPETVPTPFSERRSGNTRHRVFVPCARAKLGAF